MFHCIAFFGFGGGWSGGWFGDFLVRRWLEGKNYLSLLFSRFFSMFVQMRGKYKFFTEKKITPRKLKILL